MCNKQNYIFKKIIQNFFGIKLIKRIKKMRNKNFRPKLKNSAVNIPLFKILIYTFVFQVYLP